MRQQSIVAMTNITSLVKKRIVTKIAIGYLAALSLTIGIVFLAFNGLSQINETVVDVNNRLTSTRSLAQNIDTKLQLVRYYADRYKRLNQQKDLDHFNNRVTELQKSQSDIIWLISDPEVLKMVKHIQQQTLEYVEGFENITKLIMYQQMLLSTSFLKHEQSIENHLSAIRINVANTHLPNIYFSFSNARRAFELMRLHQAKYESTQDEKYFVMFKKNYGIATQAFYDLVEAMKQNDTGSEVTATVMKSQGELNAYYDVFLKVHDASQYLKELSVKLDQNEQQVTYTAAKISSQIEDEYNQSIQHTQALVLNTQVQLLAAVAVAVIINLALIWMILNNIIKPIFRELQHISNVDSLTKVANRRAFDSSIRLKVDRSKEAHEPLSLLICDVDYFKKYNDIYGHQKGDDCLVKIADCLRETCHQPGNVIARYGGEEFIIILQNTSAYDALQLAEQVNKNVEALQELHSDSSISSYVTISVGVSTMEVGKSATPYELIKSADLALYEAKRSGRNCAKQFHVS